MDSYRTEHSRADAFDRSHCRAHPYQHSDTDSEHHADAKHYIDAQANQPPYKHAYGHCHTTAPGRQAGLHRLGPVQLQV